MVAKVGYKNPPTHSKFKKGKSGNPSGRPKKREKALCLSEAIKESFGKEVSVIQNGRRIKVPRLMAVLMTLQNNALKGNVPATKLVLDLAKEHVPANLTMEDLMAGKPLFSWTEEDEKKVMSFDLDEMCRKDD